MQAAAPSWKLIPALRWPGRLLAAVLFLFWGAFFVEHTVEWFVRPYPQLPPGFVWLAQGLHLLMLAGLVALWRWEVLGSLVVILTAFVFFADKAGAKFPLFFGLTALPALLVLGAWWLERKDVQRSG